MELRKYQQEAREAVESQWTGGVSRTLLVLPTGCGENHCVCQNCRGLRAQGKRVLILAHRGELLEQAADKILKSTGLRCAVEKAEESCLFQLGTGCTVGSSRPSCGKSGCTSSLRTIRHHHHRRSPPLYQRQLPPDSGLFPGRRDTGRHRHPRPGRHEGSGAGVPVPCL